MANKATAVMQQRDYDKMVDTMIQLVNRGSVPGGFVKRIAKAGNIKPVMDYINRMHKFVVKYAQERNHQPVSAPTPRKPRSQRGKKSRRNTTPAESASE